MPDEVLIAEIESILNQVVELGAATERTRMVPNLLVRNDNPGKAGFILVRDDRDGDNVLARTVPGVIYNTNDLVNVLFIQGGEAIAFQQGSESSNSNIWGIVSGTSTDIFYNSGDVGIGKSVAPDARLELLDATQPQLRLTHTEDVDFVDFAVDTNGNINIDPSGGTVYIKDTANTDMTVGLTIQQGANDDEAFAVKSSDIAHGMTGEAETDTYGTHGKSSATLGGLKIVGYTESEIGLNLVGRYTTDDTGKTITSGAAIQLLAQKKSGAAVGNPGANANLVSIYGNQVARWILDNDGDSWQQGSVTLGTDIIHEGDLNTKVSFTDDKISVDAGGLNMLALTETAQDLVEIGDVGGGGDVDINFSSGQVFLRGSDGFLGIGTIAPTRIFHVESSSRFVFNVVSTDAGASVGPIFEFFRESASPAANDDIGELRFQGTNSAAGSHSYARLRCVISDPTSGSEDGQFKILTTNNSNPNLVRVLIDEAGNTKFGTNVSAIATAQLHVDQESVSAAEPVLLLDQADVDEPFTKYVGSAAAATLTRSIVAEADVTTATRQGFVKIEIEDVGNQVTDQDYFVAFYTLA